MLYDTVDLITIKVLITHHLSKKNKAGKNYFETSSHFDASGEVDLEEL